MNGKKKLLGAVITLSALSGANTFAKGNQKSKNNGSSTMSCSIDGKVRTEIKKGIKEYGHDDTVVLEIPAECRRGKGAWHKGYLYVDVKTAKSIQRNPDANEIISRKGARYIPEGHSYVMNNTSYSLQANFAANKTHEESDSIFGTIKNNLKKVFTKKEEKKTESKPKAAPVVAKKEAPKVHKPKVRTYGTPEGEVTEVDGKVVSINKYPYIKENVNNKPKATKPAVKTTPKTVATKKEAKKVSDKDIEKSINKAISKYL